MNRDEVVQKYPGQPRRRAKYRRFGAIARMRRTVAPTPPVGDALQPPHPRWRTWIEPSMTARMNVFLTFDVEVWCNGWSDLDRLFPDSFRRYIYGHSQHGDFGLPVTLEIMKRHGLAGIFFVEPLFAARFGIELLAEVVSLLQAGGQQVQLHLHPEWTDEALEPLLDNGREKRRHLTHYTLDEQTALIGHGRRLLQAAGAPSIGMFRSGSFAANLDTFEALKRNGILVDSSLNRALAARAAELVPAHGPFDLPFTLGGVRTLPVSVFRDGFGRDRPAQVGACGAAELRQALLSAHRQGRSDFVIVSHSFEMLRSRSAQPDWTVVRRFEQPCAFLAAHRHLFRVRAFDPDMAQGCAASQPTTVHPTTVRHAEQWRRQRNVHSTAPRA